MKCPHCKTNINKIPISWKCPHCDEKLPEPGFWYRFSEGLVEYLQEKGFIFWGTILAAVIALVAVGEGLLGQAYLVKYVLNNFLFSILMSLYGGMVIELYMRVVLPLHMPFGGGDFLLRERAVIRNMRKSAHIAVIGGIVASLSWLGPEMFFLHFPSYFIIVSIALALALSVAGLFLDMKMAEDVRFRYYMDRLGVTDLKRLRRICTITIGGLFIAIIGFFILNQVPELWHTISSWGAVGVALMFFKAYLSWLL